MPAIPLENIPDLPDDAPRHVSITELAAEALRTGLGPPQPADEEIPGDDETLRAGDPDDDPLEVAFSGQTAPGGSADTPDHNQVDEIGRAYGVSEAADGELKLGDDLIDPRDEERWELDPRSKDPEA